MTAAFVMIKYASLPALSLFIHVGWEYVRTFIQGRRASDFNELLFADFFIPS